MLLRLAPLVAVDEVDHVVLPPGRRRVVLVRDFVEHVVQIVHRVHDLAHVGLLDGGHGRAGQGVDVEPLAVPVDVAIEAVDVVGRMEGMPLPGAAGELHGPALEEHHRNVHARLPGRTHALAQAVEVLRVVAVKIEPGLAVAGLARAGAGKRLRRGRVQLLLPVALRVPRDRLPGPQPDEVVVEALEELQIGVEVESGGRIAGPDVHQARPRVRAGQIHGRAAPVGEVPAVAGVHAQRAASGPGRCRGCLPLAGPRPRQIRAGGQPHKTGQAAGSVLEKGATFHGCCSPCSPCLCGVISVLP